MTHRLQISVLVLLLLTKAVAAQGPYALSLRITGPAPVTTEVLGITTAFPSRAACSEYINRLPGLLQARGYVTASVDSVSFDTASAQLVLYPGVRYRWARLDPGDADPQLLQSVGWDADRLQGTPIGFSQVRDWQERILAQLENNGRPFARVFLDSIRIDGQEVSARLAVDPGPVYRIDSIRLYGTARISNAFLQRYLDLPNGSLYSRERLLQVGRKLRELPYVEEEKPYDLSLLATGSVLNLYLKPKRSSQVNVLVGFLPNNDQLASRKLLLTGEANILLRNALGSGETLGLNWQQIQVRSPRLNLQFAYPYLFGSPVGVDLSLDLLRKDSSFVTINLQAGAQMAFSPTRTGKLFVQRFQTVVSSGGIPTAQVIATRRLPDLGDVSAWNAGVDFDWNTTDYRPNPRRGSEYRVITAFGSKRLARNNAITSLRDPADPGFDFGKLYDTIPFKTYQLRTRITAAHYFPLRGGRSTVKAGLNLGLFQSGTIFRNELFQVGGFKLLRGFDEESQYLSHFSFATLEYRYLVGMNSYFYVLADGGWGRNALPDVRLNYTYLSGGLGLALETKAGIFNLAWAVGRRNDSGFNLRQSKLHFGLVNFF